MQRQHRIVRRMIGIVAGRPVDHRARCVARREIVGDRDRLVVGDEKAVLRAARRAPGAHARVGAGLHQVDRRAAAGLVRMRVRRHPFFMGAPAEFGRLHAFRQEAFDRPGVDEHLGRLRLLGALRVALGDVDALDAGLPHQVGPFGLGLRLGDVELQVRRDIEQRLLGEEGDHAGIGAAAGDGGRRAGLARASWRRASSRAARSSSALPAPSTCRNRSRATAR